MSDEATRVCVIGPGWWFLHYHLLALSSVGSTEVVGVAASSLRTLIRVGQLLPGARTYLSPAQMIDECRPDIVMVATPPSVQADAVDGLPAGRFLIFCEKPAGRSLEEAEIIGRRVRPGPNMVGFTGRFSPALQQLRQLALASALGEVRHLEYSLTQDLTAGSAEAPWELSAEEYPLGVLSDAGSHALDIAYWLMGSLMDVRITVGHGGQLRTKQISAPPWDRCELRMRFQEGATGTIRLSRSGRWDERGLGHCVAIQGTKGQAWVSTTTPGRVYLRRPSGVLFTRPVQRPVLNLTAPHLLSLGQEAERTMGRELFLNALACARNQTQAMLNLYRHGDDDEASRPSIEDAVRVHTTARSAAQGLIAL